MRYLGRTLTAAMLTLAMVGLTAGERISAAPTRSVTVDIVSRTMPRVMKAAAAPDRAIAPRATLIRLRDALKVAAFVCPAGGEDVRAGYEHLMTVHASPIAQADAVLDADYVRRFGTMAAAIRANDAERDARFFALPAVQADFCRIAAATASRAASMDAEQFAALAAVALAKLETPFYAWQDAHGATVAEVIPAKAPAVKAPEPVQVSAAVVSPRPIPARRDAAAIVPMRAPASSVGATGYVIQIGAVQSSGAVRSAWHAAVKRHEELGTRELAQSRATANGRTVYRVAAAGFSSRTEASSLCDILKSRGTACFVRSAA